jgi:hypothetical protein
MKYNYNIVPIQLDELEISSDLNIDDDEKSIISDKN